MGYFLLSAILLVYDPKRSVCAAVTLASDSGAHEESQKKVDEHPGRRL